MKKLLFIFCIITITARSQSGIFIVLDKYQKEFLDTFKLHFVDSFSYYHVYFEPVPIKDSLYILPTAVLTDRGFKCIYNALRDRGSLDKMIIRRVEEYEFIKYDIDGNIIE